MRKKLVTVILAVILVICLAFLGILIYSLVPKECKHYFCDKTVNDPTCDEKGYTLYQCTSCDYEFEADFVSPLGHTYSDEAIAPTCEKEGYALHTCTVCEKVTMDAFVSAMGHDYTQEVVAPTCEEEGYTINSCKNCDFETRSDYTSPKGHEEERNVIAPTCENEGYTINSCKNCDYEYINTYIDPTGHSVSKTTTVAPTCTTGGYSNYKCANCDYTYISDYTNPAGHKLSSRVTAPTCIAEGYTTYDCDECDYQYRANAVAPTGHTYTRTYVRPNIEQTGYTIYECSVCKSKHDADFVFYSDIFTGSAGEGKGSLALGVDVSHHSYNVDFKALKAAGVDFVIIRVGYDKTLDTKFEEYYAAAREAGLDIGVYFFTLAETKEEAKADADRVAAWLDGKTFEYPIFYDVEDDPYYSGYTPSEFSQAQMMEIAHTFMTTMVDHGYYPGLYTNNNFLYNVFNNEKTLRLYDVWYARYTTPTDALVTEYSGKYSMWQYAGNVEGYSNGAISGMCDVNYAFKDYPTIIKRFGFNGYDS